MMSMLYHEGWVRRSLPDHGERSVFPREQRPEVGNSKVNMRIKAISYCARITCEADSGKILNKGQTAR